MKQEQELSEKVDGINVDIQNLRKGLNEIKSDYEDLQSRYMDSMDYIAKDIVGINKEGCTYGRRNSHEKR